MCGLVGVAGTVNTEAQKIFQQLLIVDQLRGMHSTGVAHVTNYSDSVGVAKCVGTPEELMNLTQYEKVMKNYPKVLIGHNRWATSGKIIRANAHPFEFENVVGAHNGTLRNYTKLPGYGSFDVDSETLYHSISVDGIEKTIANIAGAYALTFWDKKNHTMNFLRNDERPLYIAEFNKGETIAWASEEGMLEWILSRNNITVEEIYCLSPDVLISIPLKGSSRTKLVPTAKMLKGGTELVAPVNLFHGKSWPIANRQSSGTETAKATATSSATASSSASVTHPNLEFAKLKDCLFRIGLKGVNAHGAEYLMCTTQSNEEEYRLYTNPNNIGLADLRMNDEIIANTNGLEIVTGRPIYRILAGSVKKVIETIEEEQPITTEAPFFENVEEETEYFNSYGKPLNKANWLKQHGTCSFCSSNIDPDGVWRFVNNDILCDECTVNPVVRDALAIT